MGWGRSLIPDIDKISSVNPETPVRSRSIKVLQKDCGWFRRELSWRGRSCFMKSRFKNNLPGEAKEFHLRSLRIGNARSED